MAEVFVRWYGKILPGEVVPNGTIGPTASMTAVRVQVQGMKATALFMPEHVFSSVQEAAGDSNMQLAVPVVKEKEEKGGAAWGKIREFKAQHWNSERNCLQTDALEEFYNLWKENCNRLFN